MFLFILQWGEQRGCTREEMISFYDSEGNVPLHSAVHGGDIKAVELCLKSGAKISTQQHDLSTPVHLACAQVSVCFGCTGVLMTGKSFSGDQLTVCQAIENSHISTWSWANKAFLASKRKENSIKAYPMGGEKWLWWFPFGLLRIASCLGVLSWL